MSSRKPARLVVREPSCCYSTYFAEESFNVLLFVTQSKEMSHMWAKFNFCFSIEKYAVDY